MDLKNPMQRAKMSRECVPQHVIDINIRQLTGKAVTRSGPNFRLKAISRILMKLVGYGIGPGTRKKVMMRC